MERALVGHDHRERVHRRAVDEDVELRQLRAPPADDLVVVAGVAAAERLQLVVEVGHDVGQRQLVLQKDARRAGVAELLLHAAPLLEQLHQPADVLLRGDDRRLDERLLDPLELVRLGQLRRAVDLEVVAADHHHAVRHPRRRRDEVEVELPLEPRLDDLHVQQPEEAAAEAEAEGVGDFRLEVERRVVERELVEGVAQVGIVLGVGRVEPGEDHRLDLAEAGVRRRRRPAGLGHRVADLDLGDVLDVRHDPADFADGERVHRAALRREDADVLDLVLRQRRHQADPLAPLDLAVDHAHEHEGAAVAVVPAVEDHRLERPVGVPLRRRHPLHDRGEDVRDPLPRLARGEDRLGAVEADDVGDLLLDPVRLGRGEVDLVDDRDDREVVLDRLVGVGERLRLDPLRGVHEQDGAFAGGERARDLVGEIHVSRGVDQVEPVLRAVLRRVRQRHEVGLDGDPALALEVHRVERLLHHLALLERAGQFEHAVGQGGLAVVDVRDDAEVADLLGVHKGSKPRGARQ